MANHSVHNVKASVANTKKASTNLHYTGLTLKLKKLTSTRTIKTHTLLLTEIGLLEVIQSLQTLKYLIQKQVLQSTSLDSISHTSLILNSVIKILFINYIYQLILLMLQML